MHAPTDAVLVIGAGAGGDFFGAASANRDVVGVEKDERQFKCLQKQMVHLCEMQKKHNIKELGEASSSHSIIASAAEAMGIPMEAREAILEGPPPQLVCTECGEAVGSKADTVTERYQCPHCDEEFYMCGSSQCSFEFEGERFCKEHYDAEVDASQGSGVPETQPSNSQSAPNVEGSAAY